ncbi:MAG: carbamate kinase [Actinomycetota bacterium]
MKRVVVALGGNALLRRGERDTADEMRRSARFAAERVAEIAAAGWEVVVTHGNGPQVGRILLQQELAKSTVAPMPLDVCGAESQGQIGYLLQVAIGDVFFERGMERPVVALVTLARVRPDDPAFAHPTKPVGPYYDEAEAGALARDLGYTMAPVSAGGWRRVVPSPVLYSIVEAPVIASLVGEGVIVIAAGGGGVPVIEDGPRLVGVEGVVDKDFAAAVLAKDVDATVLLILSDVKGVYEGYGTDGARIMPSLTPERAEGLLAQGEFGEGSMSPKVRAAVEFVQGGGDRAVIAALEDAVAALEGEAGTVISA